MTANPPTAEAGGALWPGRRWVGALVPDGRPSWRAIGLAWLAGGLGAFAFAPFSLTPLFILSFGVLIRLIDASGIASAAFRISWWFSFGFFTLGLWWIANALLVDAAQFWWMVPFAVLALPAALALFPAIAIAVAKRLVPNGLALALAIALAWSLAELARSTLFTGFPWNLAGQSWAAYPVMAQTASLWGVHGLSLVTVLSAVLIGTARLRPVMTGGAMAAGLLIFGLARLPSGPVDSTETLVRLVQPNIPQVEKWKPERRSDHLQNLIELTIAPPAEGGRRPDLVIWPETAVPLVVEPGNDIDRLLSGLAADRILITGAIRAERNGPLKIYNSLVAYGEGRRLAHYDKSHLVPFGEYVPFSDYLSFMRVAARVNFTPGPGPETLSLDGIPAFSPLICYEIIFPGAVARPDARPAWLLNLTNDAWYGVSNGPFQHRMITRLRAIEEGVPVIRVANTGISEVVDPYGRAVTYIPLKLRDKIDIFIPSTINGTFFRLNPEITLIFLILTLSFVMIVIKRIDD